MNSSTYLKIVLAGFLGLLGAFALWCRIVDPFWYYRDVSIPGFNAVKPEFKRFERYVKPEIVRRERPASLVFGNSYAEIGFDPLHPALTRTESGERGYNFALAGAEWDRVYCSVLFALEYASPKRVVIGFQPGHPLKSVDCGNATRRIPPGALLLSRKAIKASFRTFSGQRKKPTHTAEGMFYYTRFEVDDVERRFRGDFSRYLAHLKPEAPCLREPSAITVPPAFNPATPKAKTVPPELAGLHDLLVRLVRAGVETKLVAYPVHALRAEADIACGFANLRWEALLSMARLVRTADPEGRWVQIWDFQGYDPDLLEPIRNNETRLWQDVGHFNYEFGNRMLDRMFSKTAVPAGDGFGTVIDEASLPTHRDSFFRARSAFQETHPGFMTEFADLVEPFRKTH